jgi:hypothetical protein
VFNYRKKIFGFPKNGDMIFFFGDTGAIPGRMPE